MVLVFLIFCLAQVTAIGEKLFQYGTPSRVKTLRKIPVTYKTQGPIPLDSIMWLKGDIRWADERLPLEYPAKSLLEGIGMKEASCWQRGNHCITINGKVLILEQPIEILGHTLRAPRLAGTHNRLKLALVKWSINSVPHMSDWKWGTVLKNIIDSQYISHKRFASPIHPNLANKNQVYLRVAIVKVNGIYTTRDPGSGVHKYMFNGTFPTIFGNHTLNGILKVN
ncbi:hypothetical protein DSO57_1020805 [Entomophthora muscae]|uniref:Uncharacterized protein n=1 Tax=Entomophthora muscae TaxID=34485 RepID=A0ACC2T402_9FUNG|nr:hypothetical protein DSO57_1020805 [Entomophthora muscae]